MKKILMLIACMLALSPLAACQATPKKPVVIQKDQQQMIDKAKATSSPGTSTRSLKDQLNVPDNLKEELASAKGKLKIHVNADVIVPNATAIPAATIGMGTFTEDDVHRLYKALCGDATPIASDNSLVDTKACKMREIQSLLDEKKSGKLDGSKYDTMAELDAAISKVTKEAANLPDHFKRVEPDFSFKTRSDSLKQVYIRVAPDDATISDLIICNAPQGQGGSYVEYHRDLDNNPQSILVNPSGAFLETESPYFQPPSMSADVAQKLADDKITALGLKDFVCTGHVISTAYDQVVDAKDAKRYGVYEYMYTRQIGNVPITYTDDIGNVNDNSSKNGNVAYTSPWLYEKVQIIIDDKGVLCLRWNSPYVITDIVTNSSAMLTFDKMQNTFEKMIPVVNNIYDTSDQDFTCDMYVTQIRLGLMRVTEKDTSTSGLVIPVWDFMGYTKDSRNNINGKDGYHSVLTLNAIDGSIIDRSLGY